MALSKTGASSATSRTQRE